MGTGAVRDLVTCSASRLGPPVSVNGTVVSCTGTDGVSGTLQFVSGYIIDPTQQSYFDLAITPLDYGVVSAIWGSVFCFVLGLYFVSKSVGSVLSVIRR